MSAVLADMPKSDMSKPVTPATTKAIAPSKGDRPWTFYVLATLFSLYVVALYGPMFCIYVLSFQDIRGGLVFPMKGHSLHWFVDLFTQVRTGDVIGSFDRSIKLAVIVTIITVAVSFLAGLGFRKRFRGDTFVFYMMIGSLVAPGLVLGLGTGLLFQALGLNAELVHLGARGAALLDAAVRRARDVRGDVALQPCLGGGGP
ncbi:ABC-type spermidine/putrescine transport system permease subunit II [Bradyrhizobium sp. GM24.11]